MAVFAIPNPKKTTQVDFPIDRVKFSVLNINLENNKYKFTKANEIFNQYTYEATEFLSLGVFIDINLNKISEEKTEITVEIRRKLGTFDQSFEVTKANEHLVKIFDCIANLTTKTPEEIENLKNTQIAKVTAKNSSPNKTKNTSNFNQESHSTNNKWYEKTGLVIFLCIIFFPVGLYALWKNSSIAKGWKIAVTSLISIILIANIGGDKTTNTTQTIKEETEQTIGTVTVETPIAPTVKWQFSEDVDKMTSKTVNYASIQANEELEFNFPYDGGSVATLTIRKKDGTIDIYLNVSKGQFNSSYDGGSIRIKFDNDSPKTFSFSAASDGSSDIIFINSTKTIISKLKTTKQMIIEVEFYNEGLRQIEFDVDGFEWK
ncbi:hypothetical protein [Flavobacterium aquatile]|uniref:hypothetical protein n=1 Tax=Flavobacterium aquatile TaxID=245 RepID=UPI00068E40F7|nr:hypothetical protein [Flavobacterium aquatile]OXA65707.1 hypothetical protein B0A61_13750 [Flavobacterium aquatile LMG 4008 = ATCC 11947]GEC78152.1 hypothetical protein FAQ01_10220 [Flavobacterium aquatile]